MDKELDQLKSLFSDTTFLKHLGDLNNLYMDFNIFEITGMGSQEIKHSNLLSWLFGDNPHGFGYMFFEKFLQRLHKDNPDEKLKKYIKNHKHQQLEIFRERYNIDIIIADVANKAVFCIENKVFSTEGDGQLAKYEKIIEDIYPDFDHFYIYLSAAQEEPSHSIWYSADYEIIHHVINEILDSDKELSSETKMLLDSYIDLIRRGGLVMDPETKEICENIWSDKKYRDALRILIKNKPDNKLRIAEIIESHIKDRRGVSSKRYKDKPYDFLIKTRTIRKDLFDDNDLLYNLHYDIESVCLAIYVNEKKIAYNKLYKDLFPKKKKRHLRNLIKKISNHKWEEVINDVSLSDEELRGLISDDINKLLDELIKFDKQLAESAKLVK
jgi:hypothetical protein